VRSKYLDTLSDGTYISSLFLAIVGELYLDTERPVILTNDITDFNLEEGDDEELKLQHNAGHILSLALRFASSLMR
jgi:LTN1 family HEAT repeat region